MRNIPLINIKRGTEEKYLCASLLIHTTPLALWRGVGGEALYRLPKLQQHVAPADFA